MKEFKIKLRLYGTMRFESPLCPVDWMGSGCEVEEMSVINYVECLICAKSRERAMEIIADTTFDDGDTMYESYSLWGIKEREVGDEEECIEVTYL